MQSLGRTELTLIFQRLPSLMDAAELSQTCKRCCWLLWRDDQQQVLWSPRIAERLDNSTFLRRFHLERMMPRYAFNGFSQAAVEHSIKSIWDSLSHTLDQAVKGFWFSGAWQRILVKGAPNLLQNRKDDLEFRTQPDENGISALYTVVLKDSDPRITCYRGNFDAETKEFNHGDYYSPRLVYRGDWHNGIPHGRGTAYDENGNVRLDGNFMAGAPHGECALYDNGKKVYQGGWIGSKQHGQGTQYYLNGNKLFEGTWEAGHSVFGTWFSTDGAVIHHGPWNTLAERLDTCIKQKQCTYTITERCYMRQRWYHCRTCFGDDDNAGVCESCADLEHKYHALVLHEASTFFCDCGAGLGSSPCHLLEEGVPPLTPPAALPTIAPAIAPAVTANIEDDDAVDDDAVDDDEQAMFRALEEHISRELDGVGMRNLEITIRRRQ